MDRLWGGASQAQGANCEKGSEEVHRLKGCKEVCGAGIYWGGQWSGPVGTCHLGKAPGFSLGGDYGLDCATSPPEDMLKSSPLVPKNVPSFGHRVFAEMIELKWEYQVDQKP